MFATLLILVAAAVCFRLVRNRLNDSQVPCGHSLFRSGEAPRLLAVWAHPDDEIAAAGTLALAARNGKTAILYLTAGEAAKSPGYDRAGLATVRRAEATAAGALLGAETTRVLDFADGGLMQSDGTDAKQKINALIDSFRPTILISFDGRVGYYGHPDHIQTGRWLEEIFAQRRDDPSFAARRLYQVTLPVRLIALTLRFVAAFRDHYPADDGLPIPTFAVRIARMADVKRKLLDVHRSQAGVIRDVQPFYDRLPAFLYYRLLDREYFALAASR